MVRIRAQRLHLGAGAQDRTRADRARTVVAAGGERRPRRCSGASSPWHWKRCYRPLESGGCRLAQIERSW